MPVSVFQESVMFVSGATCICSYMNCAEVEAKSEAYYGKCQSLN